MPIALDVTEKTVQEGKLAKGTRIALRDLRDDVPLAILTGTADKALGNL